MAASVSTRGGTKELTFGAAGLPGIVCLRLTLGKLGPGQYGTSASSYTNRSLRPSDFAGIFDLILGLPWASSSGTL